MISGSGVAVPLTAGCEPGVAGRANRKLVGLQF